MNHRLLTGIAAIVGLAIYITLTVIAQRADGEPVNNPIAKNILALEYEFTTHLPVVIKQQDICKNSPTLLGPANGTHLDNIIPLFKWDSGNDPAATTLRLRLAKDPEFNEGVSSLRYGSSTGIGQFRFSRNRDPATTYYWQTWLECDEIDSPYSEVWSFTTGSGGAILPAPNLITPTDGTELSSLPTTFEWSAVNGTVEYIMHWREIGQGGYTYNWVDKTNKEMRWLEPAANYEWWVTARNNYAIGDDSKTWQFKSPAAGSAAQLLHNRPGGFVTIEQYDDQFIYTYVEQGSR